MNPETDPAPSAQAPRKPRFAYLIATSLGLGYLRPAPGTWGSLAGVVVAMIGYWVISPGVMVFGPSGNRDFDPFILFQILIAIALGLIGVITSWRVSAFSQIKDPQFVVIDEVSGQQLTLLLGGFGNGHAGIQLWNAVGANHPLSVSGMMQPNWKYLLLGFILFRGFDIWKPFPVRQLESLPGGWGIMADDWGAAVYAAAGLWIARALGL
jgi:phosphatidylglycerophosphatase A